MNHQIAIEKVNSSSISGVDFDNLPFGAIFSDHMFVADYKDGKWVDARVIPFQNMTIHPGMISLHYGQSIFEGMKASKGKDGTALLFRPEMHAKRLNHSARRMCMPDFPEDLFMEALHTLVGIDQGWIPPAAGSAMYIRPFMVAMDDYIGVHVSNTYRFMIITAPVGPYYSRPVRLKVEQHYVRAVPGGTGEAKCAGNYAASLLPAKLAKEQGYDQVMWMGGPEKKHIQEVGTMNMFFVIDDKVITPATDGAILHGITRDSAIQLLRDKGLTVEVRPITIDEVMDAHQKGLLQEAFGTGTAAVVAHVSGIGYNGTDISLPPMDEREHSLWLKDTFNAMRAQTIDDPYGWVVPVRQPELAV